jgi:hypothetical protein
VRRTVAFLAAALCLFAACSSDDSDEPAAPAGSTTTVATSGATASTTTTVSTTAPSTTTTAPCHAVGGTDPVTTAATGRAALLRDVGVSRQRCADRVTFDFTTEANGKPKCTVAYAPPPFTMDGSGEPVSVAGSAFVRVRCEPAYGYDFENGMTTYTGPKQITATGTQHVRELVETGDFEAVLTWIIGLDVQRPFAVATTTVSGPQARMRLAIRFF